MTQQKFCGQKILLLFKRFVCYKIRIDEFVYKMKKINVPTELTETIVVDHCVFRSVRE